MHCILRRAFGRIRPLLLQNRMRHPTLLFLIAINYILITNLTLCEYVLCQPSEEGHKTSITFRKSFYQQNIHITVERFSYTIARCYIPGNCKDEFPKHFNTTLSANPTSVDVTITVTVFNTSREIEKLWYLVHKEVVANCNVLVFSRPQFISCSEEISYKGLHISCWSSTIYPEAKCHISITFTNAKNLLSGIMMNCVNEKHPMDTTYYRPNCSFMIPVDKLISGQYDIKLTMYPNVTGRDTDVGFGTNHSLYINLDITRLLLKDSPKIIEENANLICVLDRSNTNLVQVTLRSFDNIAIRGNETRTGRNNMSAYFCQATDVLGLAEAFYLPIKITKIKSLNCSKFEIEGTICVSCSTDKIQPLGVCQVIIYEKMQTILRNSHPHNYKKISYYETLDWSFCEFNITKSYFSHGHYEMLVTMYPNVTGNVNDKHFGANQSISININIGKTFQ